MKILFMGDSITDVGKNATAGSCTPIGQGYPLIASAYLGAKYPEKFTFINNGISGNRIVDLYARIKADVWNHEPDVLSILIGVNDVWHEIGWKNGVNAERFERMYRMFLEDTKTVLPGIKFMILEPFILKGSATEGEWERFRTETELRAADAKKVAEEFDAIYIPLQQMFDEAAEIAAPAYWLPDGVHPSPAGHQLIANKWIDAFEKNLNR